MSDKSAQPDQVSALIEGITIIAALDPDQSNDPETRGITGAMHKRLWLATRQPAQLDLAIRHYRRGFEVRGDYYNGENLATCYDMRAELQTNRDEALFDRMSAQKTRREIVVNLTLILEDQASSDRSDLKWIHATMANCLVALGDETAAFYHEERFRELKPALWEIAIDYDLAEVRVSRAILKQARRTFLVADHSKLTRSAPARIASLSEIDTFFTDLPPPDELIQRCSEWETSVCICPPEDAEAF